MRFRRRTDVLWRTADSYLVVSTVAGEGLQATGPAPEIWHGLGEWITIDDLSADLAERHGADSEQVRRDVTAFIDQLIDEGYVESDG
jgi:hypothetical protein